MGEGEQPGEDDEDRRYATQQAGTQLGEVRNQTQVNVHKRIVVMDLSEDRSEPRVFINPEFEPLTDEMEQYQEGCLSVPGFYENVDRPQKVKVKALDRDGKPYELIAEGLLAVCIQHECDHLNGKLFVDYLSNLKRDRIKKKLEKLHRQNA
ncbi:peptide deformylase [Pseudomonas mandelii]|uniref:peptide deformylase n=1 Tax=Pseudomonas mandelii TaxID=75612 RepID=UPI003CFE7EAD